MSPEEVERIQRSRLCAAMAEVMAEKGYVATSVADVLKRSGVSRHSFYLVFDSKIDCFMAAFDVAIDLLLQRLVEVVDAVNPAADGAGANDKPGTGAGGGAMVRFEVGLTAYLEALTIELPYTRLFLIEVYAAGTEAVRRRTELQGTITAMFADVMGVTTDAGRFTCQMIVAAISTLVTNAVTENDVEAVRAIGPPLVESVRTLWDAGAFGNRPAASS